MSAILKPGTAEQLEEALAWALAEKQPLEVMGQGSKRGWSRPMQTAAQLDLTGLQGITLYEPEELVLSARAGTPLAEIHAALEAEQQELAFEPGDWAALWGERPGAGTIGGILGCNMAGSRRIRQGAARDHFLGFSAATGRGETVKSGGRVVKNVTGYDLSKLLCGSFGTLAAMSEVTVKVLPKAEETRSILVLGLEDTEAVAALSAALGSPNEVSGAAHLPAAAAHCSEVSRVGRAGGAVTALRLEGPGPSVAARSANLRQELSRFGETEELPGAQSRRLWREITDLNIFVQQPELVLWRVSLAPSEGPGLAAAVLAEQAGLHFYDWGGGLVWLGLRDEAEAGAERIRGALRERGGGHATLLRGPEALRQAVPLFQPLPPALAALSKRVKEAFDPEGILNPGRMYAEF